MDCRAPGITVTLDDFGTGQASPQHLRSPPIDSIEIDRSFVSELAREPADRILVQSMISAAQAFGIEALAEDIETEEQNRLLITMGCVYRQEYLFAPPLPEEALWNPIL